MKYSALYGKLSSFFVLTWANCWYIF